MFGPTVGSISLRLRKNNQVSNPIWKKSGNYGNLGRFAHVTVTSDAEFQLVLEGVVGSGSDGDAAIDDIEFVNGSCYSEGSCSFEDDFCGYHNTFEGDNIDWTRAKGQNSNPTIGPIVDHTTGLAKGYFAAVYNSNEKLGEKAWLVSEFLTTPDSACLNWCMHLKGE